MSSLKPHEKGEDGDRSQMEEGDQTSENDTNPEKEKNTENFLPSKQHDQRIIFHCLFFQSIFTEEF
jgi:hypothetical protein